MLPLLHRLILIAPLLAAPLSATTAPLSFQQAEPITEEPVEVWEQDLAKVLTEPVVLGQRIYCLAPQGDLIELIGLDLVTGEVVLSSSFALDPSGPHDLAATGRNLLVSDGTQVLCVRPGSSEARELWSGSFPAFHSLLIDDGLLILSGLEEQLFADATTGVPFASSDQDSFGEPVIVDGRLYSVSWGSMGGVGYDAMIVRWCSLPKVDTEPGSKLARVSNRAVALGALPPEGKLPASRDGQILCLELPEGERGFALSNGPFGEFFYGTQGSYCRLISSEHMASHGGKLYGIGDGFLMQERLECFTMQLYQFGSAAVVPGPPIVVGDVMYSGNYAFDLGQGRMLWVAPGMPSSGMHVPAGDNLLVTWSAEGQVSLWAGPQGTAKLEERAVLATNTLEPLPLPSEASGLLLLDGRAFPDAAPSVDDSYTTAAGESFPGSAVALFAGAKDADAPEETRILAREDVLFDLTVQALESRRKVMLRDLFESYAAAGLEAECERLLAQASDVALRAGLETAFMDLDPTVELDDKQTRALLEAELEAREDYARLHLDATEWANTHGQHLSATLLIEGAREAERELLAFHAATDWPGRRAPKAPRSRVERSDVATLALFGAGEPGDPEFVEQWTRALMRSGAAFEDPSTTAPDQGAFALITEHLRLRTPADDPELAEAVLFHAELGLELAREGFGERDALSEGGERFDLLVHQNAISFNLEVEGTRSAGNTTLQYHHADRDTNRIHLYLAARPGSEPQRRAFVEGAVAGVVELYVRGHAGLQTTSRRGGTTPALLDGYARYIACFAVQLHEPGMDKERLEERTFTAPLMLLLRQLHFSNRLMAPSELLSMSALQLLEHTNKEVLEVRMPGSGNTLRLTARRCLELQGAGLVHFLSHAAEPGAGERVIALLAAGLEEGLTEEPYQALGYASWQDLDEAYSQFLSEL